MTNMSASYPWLSKHQQSLVQQISTQRLPHALLMTGEAGAGKSTLALWLAARLACVSVNHEQSAAQSAADNEQAPCGYCKHCKLIASQSFPDLLIIDEGDKSIGVEPIRAVTKFLETRPQIASQKTVLIKQVEQLTVAAANALLKTLEEPSLGNTLVLTTKNTESLLPTILSRCQLISLRPLLTEQFKQNISDQPYANTTYLPELQSLQENQAYEALASATIDLLVGTSNFPLFEQTLLTGDRALIWLERIVSTLLRVNQGWQAPESDKINWHAAQSMDSDTLMRIFQVILSANKRSRDYQQANQDVLTQQLAITIKEIVTV
ncbi:AAA family ATPase [Thalassotalea montiporae]